MMKKTILEIIMNSKPLKRMSKIHPSSDVQTDSIGPDTIIWQNCVILKNAQIGSNCNINFNVFIENEVIIGDNVTIKPGVQIWDGLTIGDNVFIGPNVTFTNDLFPRSKQYPDVFLKTNIEDGASIGANSTIIAGCTIGRYSMIGAGSVITKSILPFSLWYGNPARHKGYVTRQGIKLTMELKDTLNRTYVLIDSEPILI
jgi:UDP-2-acetamido-3-amino-2,3-dideoxy-glucuronate N-acetyltransferase